MRLKEDVMNYPMAIVIAAALIAGAMFFSNQNDLGAAGNGESAGVGVDTDDTIVNAIRGKPAWAVNTQTGEMRFCFWGTGANKVLCWNEREDSLP